MAGMTPQMPAPWVHSPERGGTLSRRYTFASFPQAMAFMVQVAFHAEQHNHHPEWSNVYNRVDVCLTTHDAGGLTPRDITLAQHMDAVAAQLGASA